MEGLTCCFTGHRQLSPKEEEALHPALARCVADLVSRGVTDFLCGGAVGFDCLAAEEVLLLRHTANNVRLILVQPCRMQDRYYSFLDKAHYQAVFSAADEIVTLAEHYYHGCMHVRNRYMVDRSSVVVAYCTRTAGGTYYTVRYAEKMGKSVHYLDAITP